MSYFFEGADGTVTGMDSMPSSSVSDWGGWFQNMAGQAMQAAVGNYRMRQVIDAGGVPAVDSQGNIYTEGQRSTAKPGVTAQRAASNGGMSESTILLLVAGVAAVLMLKD